MGEIADEMINRMLGFGRRSGRRQVIRNLELVKIHYHRVKQETEKALLMDIKGAGELWIPKSIISCRSKHIAMLHKNVYQHILADESARQELDDLLPDLGDED